MSSLPLNIDDDDDDSLINGAWSVYQEMILEQQPTNYIEEEEEEEENSSIEKPSKINSTPKAVASAGILLDKGLKSMKISKPNSKKRIRKNSTTILYNENAEEGTSSSFVKKLDHNAKERIRRMKLNASYLALRALLPDSRRSKKRWSAPSVVDKVLKYIPELEDEIQELESKKENNVHELAAAKKNKKKINDDENIYPTSSHEYENRTISVNEINKGEAIVQICMSREDEQNQGGLAFTNLLQSVEDDQGICMIKSVSTVYVCESRTCYHLHIQMNHISDGVDYIAQLRDKLLSWLR